MQGTTSTVPTFKDIDRTLLQGIPNPSGQAYEVNIIVSYERLINIIYDDVMAIFEPERLRVVMVCNPRGGISSRLTIDSDWKARGGPEKFNNWQSIENERDVLM